MKTKIHPDYVEARVHCACGNEWHTRSTKPDLHVEICSNCHPFFTGQQRIVDTAGRVERFAKRLEKSQVAKATAKPKKQKKVLYEVDAPPPTPEAPARVARAAKAAAAEAAAASASEAAPPAETEAAAPAVEETAPADAVDAPDAESAADEPAAEEPAATEPSE
jgi:large subunit ribosomal protein L31